MGMTMETTTHRPLKLRTVGDRTRVLELGCIGVKITLRNNERQTTIYGDITLKLDTRTYCIMNYMK
jgi:hypothetical protein